MRSIALFFLLLAAKPLLSQDAEADKIQKMACRIGDSLYAAAMPEQPKEFTFDEFKRSIPEAEKKEIKKTSISIWERTITDKDRYDMALADEQKRKSHLITWNHSYASERNFSGRYGDRIDGIKVSISNSSDRVIKYVRFKVKSINAVGDPIAIDTKVTTGPVEKGSTGSWILDCQNLETYTDKIDEIRIFSVTVEYMDLTKTTINDIPRSTIDPDLPNRLDEIRSRLEAISDSIYMKRYSALKSAHDIRNSKLIERANLICDSIEAITNSIRDSLLLRHYKSRYLKMKSWATKMESVNRAILKIASLERPKKKFVNVLYGIDADISSICSRKILDALSEIDFRADTLSLSDMRRFSEKFDYSDFISKTISITSECKYKLSGDDNERDSWLNFNDRKYISIADYDFISNPLRKTDLYRNNKDEYKRKLIESIKPIEKHFGLMYVYGGGRMPVGATAQIHIFSNLGFYAEYKRDTGLENILDDAPESYPNLSGDQVNGFFSDVKDKNLYKHEDDWDRTYRNFSMGALVPMNYRKNLLLGVGYGKTYVTEYKRYALPELFQSGTSSITMPKEVLMANGFYLKSHYRKYDHLNLSVSMTYIIKPFSIRLGVDISDKDRRDSKLNIGIGITL